MKGIEVLQGALNNHDIFSGLNIDTHNTIENSQLDFLESRWYSGSLYIRTVYVCQNFLLGDVVSEIAVNAIHCNPLIMCKKSSVLLCMHKCDLEMPPAKLL